MSREPLFKATVITLYPRLTSRLTFGIIIVVLGALWTLENLGLIDADQFIRWWPLLMLVFGVVRLFGIDGHRHVTVGFLAIGFGGWFLANELGVIEVSVWRMWPVALMIVGLAMVSRALGKKSHRGASRGVSGDDDERLNVFAVWSGVGRKVTSQVFQGGEITAIMGGADIDLRSAGTPPDGATLDLFVWMGGVEIFVPRNMRVINELTAVMGGIEDTREAPSQETVHTVRLRGLVLWGGIEIKS